MTRGPLLLCMRIPPAGKKKAAAEAAAVAPESAGEVAYPSPTRERLHGPPIIPFDMSPMARLPTLPVLLALLLIASLIAGGKMKLKCD